MVNNQFKPRNIPAKGRHWHFVNFLSTLIGPALLYTWSRRIDKQREAEERLKGSVGASKVLEDKDIPKENNAD